MASEGRGITIKSEADIQKMKKAGRVVEEVLALMERMAEPGVTTDQLDREAAAYIKSCGARASFFNYRGFPKSICASVNEQVVHGIPGGYRLKDGDILSVDVGAVLDGWHGDAARTLLIGNVSEEVRDLVRVTKESFFKGLEFAREGYRLYDISRAIEDHAKAHGYGVVRELVGHGIGRELHEEPDVPNFRPPLSHGRGVRLRAGMTIAIEPMINMGTAQIRVLNDGWTVVTADGKPSAHYENTIAITQGAPLLLTLSQEEEQHV